MVIVLSGGGTAGHINPALAVAEVLESRGHTVLFAGTPQGVEARLVREAGIPFTAFEAAGFDRSRQRYSRARATRSAGSPMCGPTLWWASGATFRFPWAAPPKS